jgi:hypothetical protein
VPFSAGGDAVVSSSPERFGIPLPPITDELASVLAFYGQRAFALGTVIALAEVKLDLGERSPSWVVATAAEDCLSFGLKRSPTGRRQGRGP